VSIRAAADAVGVTPPSIYLHFADKTELIFAICERYFEELGRVTTEARRGSVDPVESLRLLGRAYIQFGLDNPEPYRVLFMRKPSATPLPFQYEMILESSGFSNLVRAVSRAIEAGRIEGDPMLVATYLWSVVHGLTSLLISKPDFPWPDLDPLIDQVTRSALRGVLAEA
jgi:AcrR family transcriptional regulator